MPVGYQKMLYIIFSYSTSSFVYYIIQSCSTMIILEFCMSSNSSVCHRIKFYMRLRWIYMRRRAFDSAYLPAPNMLAVVIVTNRTMTMVMKREVVLNTCIVAGAGSLGRLAGTRRITGPEGNKKPGEIAW